MKTTLGAEITLREAGWRVGEARLLAGDDALAADDRRAVAIEVRVPPRYLLLTRQPATTPASAPPPSSYYLHRALAPFAPREARPAGNRRAQRSVQRRPGDDLGRRSRRARLSGQAAAGERSASCVAG